MQNRFIQKKPMAFADLTSDWHGENENWEKRRYNKYEIGWCGQNALLANELLCEAIKHRKIWKLVVWDLPVMVRG